VGAVGDEAGVGALRPGDATELVVHVFSHVLEVLDLVRHLHALGVRDTVEDEVADRRRAEVGPVAPDGDHDVQLLGLVAGGHFKLRLRTADAGFAEPAFAEGVAERLRLDLELGHDGRVRVGRVRVGDHLLVTGRVVRARVGHVGVAAGGDEAEDHDRDAGAHHSREQEGGVAGHGNPPVMPFMGGSCFKRGTRVREN